MIEYVVAGFGVTIGIVLALALVLGFGAVCYALFVFVMAAKRIARRRAVAQPDVQE